MKTVVIFSGGLDSTVLLADRLVAREGVHALSFDYGQRHRKELLAAAKIANQYGVPHRVVSLAGITQLWGSNSLTHPSVEVPEGHYTDTSMRATVVPNRNLILLSVASAWALGLGYEEVAYGAHAGDHTVYPDCRPEFVLAMDATLRVGSEQALTLACPFMDKKKKDIVARGVELGAPMHLSWSCYRGGLTHCGKCGTCVERREAFVDAGVPDPTEYE